MVSRNITVRVGKALRKLRALEKEIEHKSALTVQDLGKAGKQTAKALTPVDTGFTYKSIKRRTVRRASGDRAEIFIEPAIRPVDGVHRKSVGQYPNFNLVRWMHVSPRARSHITSGDPKFMYTTRNYLNQIKGKVARGRFKTIKIR